MVDLYAAEGDTVDEVETLENTPGVMTPILKIVPERGMFLRFLNNIDMGEGSGLPLFFKLRSAADTLLPMNTDLQLQASVNGMNGRMNVSERVRSIDFWNNNSITTQQNKDNVHNAKVNLTHPESSPQSGTRESIDIRDIDAFYVSVESSAVVNHDYTKFLVESDAVEEYPRNQG